MNVFHSKLLCLLLGLGTPPATARGLEEPASAPAAVTMMRMRDGSIEWGRVRSHDSDGIVFERLENGGVVRLGWMHLDSGQEKTLRSQFGYVDTTGEELSVEADRLALVDGSEIVGLIVGRSDDALLLKQNGLTVPVPKHRIAGASTVVQVAASAIYTREELYARELARLAPAQPKEHFALAQFCEQILDYAHAKQHYAKAAELDSSFRKDDVRVALGRVTEKEALQTQIDYLAEIDLLAARRKYDEALARASGFGAKFAGSALVPDAKKRHDRIVKARDRDVAQRVLRKWHEWAGRLARNAAKLEFEQALSYADEQMSKEIEEHVTKDMLAVTKAADASVIRGMWKAREKTAWLRASYGFGTWLLGEQDALAGKEPEKEAKKEALTEKDQQRAELEARMQRFLKNQELVRKSRSNEEKTDEVQTFWSELPSSSRAQWILAYYAEKGGDMEVDPKPLFSNCSECGGIGVRELSLVGANVAKNMIGKNQTDLKIECPTCHGLGAVRRISYR
jgi:hypothetical protein